MKHTYYLRRLLTATAAVMIATITFGFNAKETAVSPTVPVADTLPTLPTFGGEVSFSGSTSQVTYLEILGCQKVTGPVGLNTLTFFLDHDDVGSITYHDFKADSITFNLTYDIKNLANTPQKCYFSYTHFDNNSKISLIPSEGTVTFVRVDGDTYRITFSVNTDTNTFYNENIDSNITITGDILSQYVDYKHPIGSGTLSFHRQAFPLHYANVAHNSKNTSYTIHDLQHNKNITIIINNEKNDGEYQLVKDCEVIPMGKAVAYVFEEDQSGDVNSMLTQGNVKITRDGLYHTIELSGTSNAGTITLTYKGYLVDFRTHQFAY